MKNFKKINILYQDEKLIFPLNLNLNFKQIEISLANILEIDLKFNTIEIFFNENLLNTSQNSEKKIIDFICLSDKEIEFNLRVKDLFKDEIYKLSEEVNKIKESEIVKIYNNFDNYVESIKRKINTHKREFIQSLSDFETSLINYYKSLFETKNLKKLMEHINLFSKSQNLLNNETGHNQKETINTYKILYSKIRNEQLNIENDVHLDSINYNYLLQTFNKILSSFHKEFFKESKWIPTNLNDEIISKSKNNVGGQDNFQNKEFFFNHQDIYSQNSQNPSILSSGDNIFNNKINNNQPNTKINNSVQSINKLNFQFENPLDNFHYNISPNSTTLNIKKNKMFNNQIISNVSNNIQNFNPILFNNNNKLHNNSVSNNQLFSNQIHKNNDFIIKEKNKETINAENTFNNQILSKPKDIRFNQPLFSQFELNQLQSSSSLIDKNLHKQYNNNNSNYINDLSLDWVGEPNNGSMPLIQNFPVTPTTNINHFGIKDNKNNSMSIENITQNFSQNFLNPSNKQINYATLRNPNRLQLFPYNQQSIHPLSNLTINKSNSQILSLNHKEHKIESQNNGLLNPIKKVKPAIIFFIENKFPQQDLSLPLSVNNFVDWQNLPSEEKSKYFKMESEYEENLQKHNKED